MVFMKELFKRVDFEKKISRRHQSLRNYTVECGERKDHHVNVKYLTNDTISMLFGLILLVLVNNFSVMSRLGHKTIPSVNVEPGTDR